MPFEAQDFSHLMGWRGDFPTRPAVARQFRRLQDVAPALMYGAISDNVFLFRAWKDALGSYPAYVKQEIGDCTSFGSGHTTDLLQCVQMVLGKQAEAYKEICTEAIYGMGRQVANMLGGGDGCYGAAVAKAVMEGVVPREAVGPYSGRRAQQWGSSGVPADVQAAAKAHPVKATALVGTVDEAQAALGNGYPFIVCSNQGFAMTRDANGCCRAQGSWAHCLSCSGYRTRAGKLEFLIDQSWGPDVPDGPLTDDQPDFSFWITSATLAKMLSEQDSFAFSSFQGFPGQPLPGNWSYDTFI